MGLFFFSIFLVGSDIDLSYSLILVFPTAGCVLAFVLISLMMFICRASNGKESGLVVVKPNKKETS